MMMRRRRMKFQHQSQLSWFVRCEEREKSSKRREKGELIVD